MLALLLATTMACERLHAALGESPHVHLIDEAASSAHAFIAARRLVDAQHTALVVVDCGSGALGVAFRDFVAGADCARRELDALVASAPEAWPPARERTLALRVERVVAELERWRVERRCAVPGGQWSRALVFWLAASLIYVSCARLRRVWPSRARVKR